MKRLKTSAKAEYTSLENKSYANDVINDDVMLHEYPFYHRGMTNLEFERELKYFAAHMQEWRDGVYNPLWKQKKDQNK